MIRCKSAEIHSYQRRLEISGGAGGLEFHHFGDAGAHVGVNAGRGGDGNAAVGLEFGLVHPDFLPMFVRWRSAPSVRMPSVSASRKSVP